MDTVWGMPGTRGKAAQAEVMLRIRSAQEGIPNAQVDSRNTQVQLTPGAGRGSRIGRSAHPRVRLQRSAHSGGDGLAVP